MAGTVGASISMEWAQVARLVRWRVHNPKVCTLYPRKRTSPTSLVCPLCAKSGHYAARQNSGYSITSSARPSNVTGKVRLSAFADLTLITNSTFVVCSTGSSAGFAPLRIRPT